MTDRKNKICLNALKLFSQYGYEAVSLEQIASTVGIKAPSLYNHFSSKNDILNSAIEYNKSSLSEFDKLYKNTSNIVYGTYSALKASVLENVRAYGKAFFKYWTTDEFALYFRRFITIGQYNDKALKGEYKNYFLDEPLNYISSCFKTIVNDSNDVKLLSAEFYGPVFLKLSEFDNATDKYEREAVTESIESYIDKFII